MAVWLVALVLLLCSLATPLHAQINVQTRITTSASLRTMLTDETGTGFAVFNAAPTFTGIPLFSGGLRTTGTPTTAIEIASGSGTTYGVYSSSTAPSYFTGEIRSGGDLTGAQIHAYTQSTTFYSAMSGHHQVIVAGWDSKGLIGESSLNHASGATNSGVGMYGKSNNAGNGDTTSQVGMMGEVTHTGAGTTGELASIGASTNTCSGGTCTRVVGLRLDAQTAGVTQYQIYSQGTALSHFAGPIQVDAPATQTIADTNTIAADACMSVKRITSAGAVTTNTTNTITAPAAANSGCLMVLCNVGGQTITLDKNANILLAGGADVVLAASSCLLVGSDGAIWRQFSAQSTAT